MQDISVEKSGTSNADYLKSLAAGDIGEQTQLAAPLADSQGNEMSPETLRELIGCENEPTIGVLQNMTAIGVGGIGTVFSAHDPVLHRDIAIKILRPAFRNKLNYVSSFIREARITAQIDHPNVIPVHRLGMFDDAGTYFTMKRVRGVTLSQILRKLKDGDGEIRKIYTRQRLLEIYVSILNGVAFAHSKGIIHRDLKPANIMVGDYGEVFIADWGLAIYRSENDRSQNTGKIELGELPEDAPVDAENKSGKPQVSGTPAFMAPEQVTGKDEDLDEQIDVYALGTILYSILTWEQSPYGDVSTVTQLMQHVVSRKFLRPRRRAPKLKIPYELEAITLKAMNANKAERYESVKALLDDVRRYLAQYPVSAYSPLPLYRFYKLIRRRPLVPLTLMAAMLTLGAWNLHTALQNYLLRRSLLTVAEESLLECEKSSNAAYAARIKLHELYTRTGKTETFGTARSLKSRYLRSVNQFANSLNTSWETLNKLLNLHLSEKQATELFARLLTNQMQFAIANNHSPMLTNTAERLRKLPPTLQADLYAAHPGLSQQIIQLEQNQGELKVITSDKSLTLTVQREGASAIALNIAPAVNKLKAGYYTLNASFSDGRKMQFPVEVIRDNTSELNLSLPERMPENMAYIPGGSFIFGDRTFDDQFARTHLDAFFISRREVSIGEYLQFWNSIASKELKERYRAYVDNTADMGRKLMPLWDDSGKLTVPYTEKMPVIGITVDAMESYCKYMSAKTGFSYRLPTALEWEKAARGVDGREYVWGNTFQKDAACLNTLDQTAPGNIPAEVGTHPEDCSVYGIYDMTGNARELVTNPGGWQYYTVKGSSFNLSESFARLAAHAYAFNPSDVGFRCAVSAPDDKNQ